MRKSFPSITDLIRWEPMLFASATSSLVRTCSKRNAGRPTKRFSRSESVQTPCGFRWGLQRRRGQTRYCARHLLIHPRGAGVLGKDEQRKLLRRLTWMHRMMAFGLAICRLDMSQIVSLVPSAIPVVTC
jgi:hypothetical protein